MRFLGFIPCLLLLLAPLVLSAQNPLYKRFMESDGLKEQSIYDVYQDSRGLMWLGTDEGLLRFDGRIFRHFAASEKYRKGVTNILESDDGVIYCQNFAGQVFKTSSHSDSIHHVSEIVGLGRFTEIALIDGHLLAHSGREYISYYDTRTNGIFNTRFSSSDHRISFFSRNTSTLSLLNSKASELVLINGSEGVVKHNIQANYSSMFYASLANRQYIINRLYPFEVIEVETGDRMKVAEFSKDLIINHISLIENDFLGIFTTSGVYIFDQNFSLIWHWFENESISGGIKDDQNNYWFSTLQNGLILVTQPKVRIGLEDWNLTCLTTNKEGVLVGTSENEILLAKGLKMDRSIYQDPTHHPMRDLLYNEYNDELLFSNQFFNKISGQKRSVQKISVNRIHLIPPDSYLLSESSAVSIVEGSASRQAMNSFSDFTFRIDERILLSEDVIRAEDAVQIESNHFLVSSTDGLMDLFPNHRSDVLYRNNKIFSIGLCNGGRDSTFIATIADGVLLYSLGKIETYLEQPNLQDKPLRKLKWSHGRLYVLYANALDVFNSSKEKIQSFSATDGISGYNFNDIEVQDESILIASDHGLISFRLDDIVPNEQTPVIEILRAQLNQTNFDVKRHFQWDEQASIVEIEFAIIDYKGLHTTNGYYSINGGEWIKAESNKITLTSLAPGDYLVQIKAINERGVCSANPYEMKFTIPTPWYSSWWFILINGLFVIGLVIVFYRRRLLRAQRTNHLLNEKIKLEHALHQSTLTSIKAQMNPHFIFNALNTIQSYIYTNDKVSASSYLVDFSDLTRLILSMSNQESVSIGDEIKAISLYLKLEKMRFEDDFEYEIKLHQIDREQIRIPPMLIQPYIENAVKHGLLHKKMGRKLLVEFRLHDELLFVDIVDNGIGITASKEINSLRSKGHQSFAMKANNKRLEILNSGLSDRIGEEIISLYDEQGNACGTHVKLRIPITLYKWNPL